MAKTLTKRRFGRSKVTDLRDWNHLALAPTPTVTVKVWPVGEILDQGQTPECVAYASKAWLDEGPVLENSIDILPDWLYWRCTIVDGDENSQNGTTVRSAMQVLQAVGYIKDYSWAFDVTTTQNWVLSTGPMVMGTIWTDSMMDPDQDNFIYATGSVAGGHSYRLIGINTTEKCPDGTTGSATIANNWGTEWGEDSSMPGCAKMSLYSLNVLIAESGEACTADKLLRNPDSPWVDPSAV